MMEMIVVCKQGYDGLASLLYPGKGKGRGQRGG